MLWTTQQSIITEMARKHQCREEEETEYSTDNVDDSKTKKRVAVTMFGVTTPYVDATRNYLTKDHD